MTRREAFRSIVSHQTPDRVLLDLGGCPLSGLSAEVAQALFDYFGFDKTPAENYESLYRELDIDTRG